VDTNRSYDVEFVKTDTIDGRDVYVLDIIPTTNQGETHYKQRLWVGTERFFPLRKRTAWTADGTREVVTTTYTNVTFNPKVPADTFQLDTDTDASVQRANTPKTEWYRTRATLKERSSISVPNPTVPPGFELVYATRTTGRINGVGLRYADDRRELTVAKFNFTLGIDADERDATVNGRPATLENGQTKSLSWNCNDYGYTIRGTNVESIRMIKVARSVGCTAGNRTNF